MYVNNKQYHNIEHFKLGKRFKKITKTLTQNVIKPVVTESVALVSNTKKINDAEINDEEINDEKINDEEINNNNVLIILSVIISLIILLLMVFIVYYLKKNK